MERESNHPLNRVCRIYSSIASSSQVLKLISLLLIEMRWKELGTENLVTIFVTISRRAHDSLKVDEN